LLPTAGSGVDGCPLMPRSARLSRRRMVERKPGIIDWFEDLEYTGLLFVAAAFLLLEVLGLPLS
jgi:hypothetical protein